MKAYNPGKPSHADYLEAYKHKFQQMLGLTVANPHPLAAATGDMNFTPLCDAILRDLGYDTDRFNGDPHRIIPMAMSTAELPEVLHDGLGKHIATRKSPALEKTLALSLPLETATYHDVTVYIADAAELPMPSAETTNRYHAVKPILAAQNIGFHSLNGNLIVPIQLAVNGPENYLKSSLDSSMNRCHDNGLRYGIVGTLEANPTMPDGTPLFHADHGNVVESGMSTTGLSFAYSALRSMETEGGNTCDADPHAILVHSDYEVSALQLVESLPEEHRPLVIASSHLTDPSTWYLFADPTLFPAIGRIRMQGVPESAFTLGYPGPAYEIKPDGKRADIPGFMVPWSYTVGFAALSHIGVVRVSPPAS